MKIELKRVDNAFHYEGTGAECPVRVHIDASPKIGGDNRGVRPMELVLMALGSCSIFDAQIILNKQRQEVDDIRIVVDGEREEGKVPSVFTKIHLHYILKGNLDENKVAKALDMALTKYCSVHDMLAPEVEITHSFEIE